MDDDDTSLALLIDRTLYKAQNEHDTRQMALVRTKLEEAKFWNEAHTKHLRDAAKRAGYNPQGNPSP